MTVDATPSTLEEGAIGAQVTKVLENVHLQTRVNDLMVTRLLELEDHVKRHQDQLESLESELRGFREEVRALVSTGGQGRQNSIYLGENLALTRVLGMFKMLVDTTDSTAACHLIADGFWDMGVTHFIRSVLHTRMRFADLGAGSGYFSLIAADAVGSRGQVCGIEADPRNFELLSKNIEMNGLGSNHGGPVRIVHVPNFDGDTLSTHLPDAVDVVRINTGGNEMKVLEGLEAYLDRRPDIRILVTVDPAAVVSKDHGRSGFLGSLKDLGYGAKRIAAGGKLETVAALEGQRYPTDSATLVLERM